MRVQRYNYLINQKILFPNYRIQLSGIHETRNKLNDAVTPKPMHRILLISQRKCGQLPAITLRVGKIRISEETSTYVRVSLISKEPACHLVSDEFSFQELFFINSSALSTIFFDPQKNGTR